MSNIARSVYYGETLMNFASVEWTAAPSPVSSCSLSSWRLEPFHQYICMLFSTKKK